MSIWKSVFSVSGFATAFMALYIGLAGYNLYLMMYPLSRIDMSQVPGNQLVKPLWDEATKMDMHVFLSTRPRFNVNFMMTEFTLDEETVADNISNATTYNKPQPPKDVSLLWKQEITAPSLSKSFLITHLETNDEESCQADESFRSAKAWLDQAERTAMERGEGGVLTAMKHAGEGIESTSFLLTLYDALSRQVQKLLAFLSLIPPVPDEDDNQEALDDLKLERTTIQLPESSPLWKALKSNSTFYLHVMVLRRYDNSPWDNTWPPKRVKDAMETIHKASQSHALLLGQVDMVKFEHPHHISKPKRILYHDLSYLWRRYVLGMVDESVERPPWDFSYSKPEEYATYQSYLDMKEQGAGYPYWKPEVSVKFVKEEEGYPLNVADMAGMQLVRLPRKTSQHPTGVAHLPSLYSSEIGLTSDKFIPINETVTTLPLRVSFDRNDVKEDKQHHRRQPKIATATAGAISPARWRLLSHLTEAIEAQKKLGFEQSDIDEVKNLIADTNISLLMITMLASALHLLFEFLTFRSDVEFWRANKSLTGLSVRALYMDLFSQTVILMFLIEKDSSLLMTGPAAVGCLIAAWKCRRASGLMFVKVTEGSPTNTRLWNSIFRVFGYELRATRMETMQGSQTDAKTNGAHTDPFKDLSAMTLEADRLATRRLGVLMAPVLIWYTFYSLLHYEYNGWYSWLVSSASSGVYAFGFIMMTPQLFLNYKMKSVAHLPWQVLIYRSLNTFIDDLFSFIVRMPTMARISCFRDDVVFIIYLYQRWMYPVDKSRPVEGGGGPLEESEGTSEKVSDTKKRQ